MTTTLAKDIELEALRQKVGASTKWAEITHAVMGGAFCGALIGWQYFSFSGAQSERVTSFIVFALCFLFLLSSAQAVWFRRYLKKVREMSDLEELQVLFSKWQDSPVEGRRRGLLTVLGVLVGGALTWLSILIPM
jgi:hypothetical protein